MASTRSRWIAVWSVLVAGVAGVVWWHTPALHVEVTRTTAVVHLESHGGGPADIRYLELSLADRDDSIWRVIGREGSFQVRTVTLAVGSNPSELHTDGGRAWTVAPESALTFTLAARTEYRLHVCPGMILGLCRTERFTLGS